jgi:hypothetical protein
MKITIGQINTTNGEVEGNVAKILSAIERAKSEGSEMIVFPEVATHGYTSFDWFLDKDIIETVEDPLEKIIPATEISRRLSAWSEKTPTFTEEDYSIPPPLFITENFSDTPIKLYFPNTTFSTIRAI